MAGTPEKQHNQEGCVSIHCVVKKTKLKDVLLIKPYVFRDRRGEYAEIYHKRHYFSKGIDISFVEDDISVSRKGVLRGLHGDDRTWKLISCLWGEFYFVVVNCDTASRQFGKWVSFTLSAKNRLQVLVPPKHGNGHFVLSDRAVFHYKQSHYYDPSRQFTYTWDEPRFKIVWPTKRPVLSKRDRVGHYV